MTKKMGISWNLRERLEQQCIHSTAELVPRLAERGIHLSRMQVYRLVAQEPQRISVDVLAALCDVLSCTPNDLITVKVVKEQLRKAASGPHGAAPTPLRTTIRRPRR